MPVTPVPKPIADMTPGERRALLARRVAPPSGDGMTLGGHSVTRRAAAVAGRALLVAAGVGVVAAAFVHFTASWRAAAVVAVALAVAMLLIARLTERHLTRDS